MFATLGLAGAGAARVAATRLMPFMLTLSILMLARAHFMVHFRGQGQPWTRWAVWILTSLVVGLWLPRFVDPF